MQQLWFGNEQRFQWVPMPSTGIQRRNVFSQESGTLDRGGAFSTRSVGRHAEFDFSFTSREATGLTGLDIYQEYATGVWDNYATTISGFDRKNLLYFVDPMVMRSNIFAPHWASPMLALSGDYPLIGTATTHAATAANVYRQPSRTITFSVTHTSQTLPPTLGQRFIIPVPPGHTLRWGWSGSVTGNAVLRAEAHHATGGATLAVNSAPLSATGSPRMDQSINGDTYDYVTFGLSRTLSTASTASVTSMMAQIWPNGTTPVLDGTHFGGLGQTGCVMMDDMVESYIQADDFGNRRLKGLSFGLLEVGAWLP